MKGKSENKCIKLVVPYIHISISYASRVINLHRGKLSILTNVLRVKVATFLNLNNMISHCHVLSETCHPAASHESFFIIIIIIVIFTKEEILILRGDSFFTR